MRAPDAPIGWPSAHGSAVHVGLSRAAKPRSRIAIMVTQAKASLISKRSTSSFAPSGSVENFADRTDGRGREPPRLGRMTCLRHDPCNRLERALGRKIVARNHDRRAPSEIEDEFAAVTVPSFAKAGLSVGFCRIGPAGLLVRIHFAFAAFARDFHADNLGRERAVGLGAFRALQRFDRKRILIAARELIFPGGVLRIGAHEAVLIGILEPVEEHVILDLSMAEPVTASGLGK